MSRNLYLKRYRLAREGEASPPPVAENGPASTFKATDTRSGAPVLLTLIPVGAIRDDDRGKFEANAKAIAQFDHVHVARTVDFGKEEDEYAFVAESLYGETTKGWVSEHGRMPPEAVLRVAIQVVSAMSAMAFNKIVHAGIRPSNIVIMPGQTAEGGWPSVKLVNLATGGLGMAEMSAPDSANFASPEQIRDGTADIRSEIYSLGATMCFLLTGVFYSAEPRSLQTRRFARPLRKLIAPMLRQNPDDRPNDPVALTESLRDCLETVERRQGLSRRLGIPVLAVRSRPARGKASKPLPRQILAPIGESPAMVDRGPEAETEPDVPVGRRRSPAFAIAAAFFLGLGIIGAAIIPVRHLFFAHDEAAKKGEIGVPIGVSQPASVWEGKPLVMNKDRFPAAPASPGVAPTSVTLSSPVAANEPPAPPPSAPAPSRAVVAQSTPAEPAPPSAGPQSVWEQAGNRPLSERILTKDGGASSSGAETPNEGNQKSEPAPESQGDDRDRLASHSNDREENGSDTPQRAENSESARPHLKPASPATTARKTTRTMTGRGSIARIASDGSVILRLPNGEIAVLPPPRDDYRVRRYHRPRRTVIERRTVVVPDEASGYPVPQD